MTGERVLLRTYAHLAPAELVHDALTRAGIEAEVRGQAGALGLGAEVELWVAAEQAEQARAWLETAEEAELAVVQAWACPCGTWNAAGTSACTACGGQQRLAVLREGAEALWQCPTCGKAVPVTLAACWNCSAPGPVDPLPVGGIIDRRVELVSPPTLPSPPLAWSVLLFLGLALLTAMRWCG